MKGSTRGTFTVTTLDPNTGKMSDMPVPPVGTVAYEAFWRPVLSQVRQRLRRRGLAGKMLLGMPADAPPPPAAVAAFRRICPEVAWFVANHSGGNGFPWDWTETTKRVPIAHVERIYAPPLPDPAARRQFGWQRKSMTLAFNRSGFRPMCLYPRPDVYAFRLLMEVDLAGGHRGVGRIGADYFRIGNGPGEGGTLYERYPASAIGQVGIGSTCSALLSAGPAGPIPSVRYMNLREGQQTAEVVIFLQRALLAGTVPEPLASRCWKLLDARVHALRIHRLGLGRRGWQTRDRKLFALAAAVVAAGPRCSRRQGSGGA